MAKNSIFLLLGLIFLVIGVAGAAIVWLASPDSNVIPEYYPSTSEYSPSHSNGELIYLTGRNAEGKRIDFSQSSGMGMMHADSCVDCHGRDGKGGEPPMMCSKNPPDIRYASLVEGEHGGHGDEAEEGEEEGHAPYTDDLIKRAITLGLEADGEPLDSCMPRFRMSERDLDGLIEYLKLLG